MRKKQQTTEHEDSHGHHSYHITQTRTCSAFASGEKHNKARHYIYIYMLLKVPRWSSASQMFVSAGVPTCAAVMCNLMYRCMCRLSESLNSIILTLTNSALSSVRLFSNMWNHWRFSTHVIMWYCGFCPCVCICMLLLCLCLDRVCP